MRGEANTPKRWIAAAVVAVVLTLTVGYQFIAVAAEGLYNEKVAYLEEISLKSADAVKEQIEGYFSTVQALSTVIGSNDSFDAQYALTVLRKEASKGFFKRMGIILPSGVTYTTDGFIDNFGDREYFQQAMKGHSVASDALTDRFDGEEINVLATPVFFQGYTVGVIFAVKAQQQFSDALTIDSFGGQGYSYIVSGDGSPVASTSRPDSLGDYTNFFDAIQIHGLTQEQLDGMTDDMSRQKTGALQYVRDGVNRQVFYAPVGVNDWYIFSVIPSRVISLQSDNLIRNLGFLVAFMVLLAITVSSRMIWFFRQNNKKLAYLAYTDIITGYPNWVKFQAEAQRTLQENPQQRFAMVVFDINKFKVVNDLFGFQLGNELLTFACEVISQCIGEGETFCRVAADNFNILMRYETNGELLCRLRVIEQEMEGYIENYKIEITFGIFTITEQGLDISAYSDKANISKNIAKKLNGENYHFFQEENRLEILYEKELENAMDSALARGEFLVYLQPKYRCDTDSIVGAEALVRWKRPNVGIIPPGEFIPLFEKNGFIRKLDFYMFEQVCRLMARWKEESPQRPPLTVSVNISRVHLSNRNLPADLRRIADQYGVQPGLIEIELTESAVFENMEEMKTLMWKIKEMGFRLSIDDFGSGYSSLASLKYLPADVVKMDKSFLDEAENDKRGEQIICSMVDMISSLGMTALAEGVETRKQLDFLKLAGCDIVQGYYWARPMPVKDFEALLFGGEQP